MTFLEHRLPFYTNQKEDFMMKNKFYLLLLFAAVFFCLFTITAGAADDAQTGWFQHADGNWYYYDDDGSLHTGWLKNNDSWYYFDPYDAIMMHNCWINGDGSCYFLLDSGKMATGWLQINYNWDDIFYPGDVETGSGSWYYFASSGRMQTGWLNYGGYDYYLDPNDGRMMQNTTVLYTSPVYYADAAGHLTLFTGWQEIGGAWLYYRSGIMQTGWQKINDNWYYFDYLGMMWYSCCRSINGRLYVFEDNGMLSDGGWVWCEGMLHPDLYSPDGHWYYTDENGIAQTGWQKINDNWYYFDPDTGAMATGWQKINNSWYYLGDNGVMRSGWVKPNSTWYYLAANGRMQTGWLKYSNSWYYLDPDTGAMLTGWQKINNSWYYLGDSGIMQSGWVKPYSTWYYLAANGKMQTGWLKYNNSWYYLDPDTGAMTADTVRTINNTDYTFDAAGRWAA